jgi:hypothetical protein
VIGDFANRLGSPTNPNRLIKRLWIEKADRKGGYRKQGSEACSKAKKLNKVREIFPSSGAMVRRKFRVCQGESRAD